MKKQLSLLDENKSEKFEPKHDNDKKLDFQRRTKNIEDLEHSSTSPTTSSEETFSNEPKRPLRRFGDFEDLRDPKIDDVMVRNQRRKEPDLNLDFASRNKNRKPSTAVPNNTPTTPGYRSVLVNDSGLNATPQGRSNLVDETKSPTRSFKSILKNPQSSTESTESWRTQMKPVPENDLRTNSSLQRRNNDDNSNSFDPKERTPKTPSHDDEVDSLPRPRPQNLVLKKKSQDFRNRESDQSSSESDRDTISNNLETRAEFRPSTLQMRRMESFDAAVSGKTDPNSER